MRASDREVAYIQFERIAPGEIWADIASLFVSVFAAPPYNESPDELQSIDQWGPDKLASPGGRLVVASHGGHVIGFALSQRLDQDDSWQQRLKEMPSTADAVIGPLTTVIVQELAVDERFRGRGIAKTCLQQLLLNRSEGNSVLGVFGQAAEALEMYRRWGFSELGTSLIYGGTVILHALHHKLPWTV
jgi:ribosomal protein S18 acetylase RimI-like enzyme